MALDCIRSHAFCRSYREDIHLFDAYPCHNEQEMESVLLHSHCLWFNNDDHVFLCHSLFVQTYQGFVGPYDKRGLQCGGKDRNHLHSGR